MSSTHTSLDSAATERKARLAKLASLKRKKPPTEDDDDTTAETSNNALASTSNANPPTDGINKHLSLRNYDAETRGPKLGFEAPPVAPDQETLETRAAQLAVETTAQEEREAKERAEGKGIDLFELQPRKPNWDLKRDLARKMDVLQQRTDNAIARIVRARLEGQKARELERRGNDESVSGASAEGGAGIGIGGADLVEGIHVREQEDAEEKQDDEESGDE